jgi:AcrR family transcriptional regulator
VAKPSTRRQRRERLLDAAQKAVIAHGTGVRLNQVAEQAGLTAGAVLYHYPDLQTLLLEANRAGMARFHDERIAAVAGITDPALKLVRTVRAGIPVDTEDEGVRLLCELGGAASRQPVYGALLTSLYDQQVAMYQVILEQGAARGDFVLGQPSLTVARNLVALEDAYGYRMMAGHPTIGHEVAAGLILDYARLATGHSLAFDDDDNV